MIYDTLSLHYCPVQKALVPEKGWGCGQFILWILDRFISKRVRQKLYRLPPHDYILLDNIKLISSKLSKKIKATVAISGLQHFPELRTQQPGRQLDCTNNYEY